MGLYYINTLKLHTTTSDKMQDTSGPVSSTPHTLKDLPCELWNQVPSHMRNSVPLLRVRKKALVDCVSVTVRNRTSVEDIIRGLDAMLQRGTKINNFYWNAVISSLVISGAEVGPGGMQTLATLLKHCKSTEIDAIVRDGTPLVHVMAVLDAMLECDAKLTSLVMKATSHRRLGVKNIQELAPRLANCRQLKMLDLYNQDIEDTGLALLKDALASNQHLAALCLEKNKLGNGAHSTIAGILQDHVQTISVLDLGWNALDNGATYLITQIMPSCTALKEVILKHNRITDDGALNFARKLLQCPSLTRLDLSMNFITDAGAVSFAPVLQQHGALTVLDLRYNEISAVGKDALGVFPSATMLPQREDLHLSHPS